MPNIDQTRKADAFRALHSAARPLLLPNVWDAATARMVEQCGYPAIATTSAGIAFAMGCADGQKISRELMMSSVSRIVQAVQVPVTADVEAGYGDTPEDAEKTARATIEAGQSGSTSKTRRATEPDH
jgi:2-methylisocitrate lyase-like PEP mutase family enzyme